MNFYVVIPARYASSRLPGKPLKDIAGKPMIQHVYESAVCSAAARVIVATDDERVASAVKAFGGEVCMTSPQHSSGTDRLQEVAQLLQFTDEDIVVNVQGDEPLIPPEVIDQVAENLARSPQASVATLSEPIASWQDFFDPNLVKVVTDHASLALYFSRAPMPWARDELSQIAGAHEVQKLASDKLPEKLNAQRHIGIYAYRVALLNRFVTWPAAPLEEIEKLEQLRVLYQGEAIHVAEAVCEVPGGIDTPADLERINLLLARTESKT
jgi:3-deoxy-manno-octulosonate cytidylyltransferase (CMP-KDO synthetase)